jgi:hypothetical protein
MHWQRKAGHEVKEYNKAMDGNLNHTFKEGL